MWPISSGGPFFYVVITSATKLSSEIFVFWHRPYAVSKFELVGLASIEKMVGNFFVTNKNMNINMKEDDENSRPLNSVCVSQVF